MSDPVLVVGAGPTGLTAALELSRLGVPVRLVDRREAPATTSRAIGVQARTLELLDQRGLADELLRVGHPCRFGSVYGGGRRVAHLDFAQNGSRYPFILLVAQTETERVLRDACARQGVETGWSTACVGLQQDGQGRDPSPVHAVLQKPDGSLSRVAAPWLIDAEGAHSIVRSTLDLPFEGHTRAEHYALGDLLIEGEVPDTDSHIFSSEQGLLTLFPLGGSRFRLIASVSQEHGAEAEPPSLALLQAILDERSHLPAHLHDLSWSSWFRINSRMVQRLKLGRLLLGGDAAHVHSPAGAQGMNTGIQDMTNLCWKMAMVMRGEAAPALLDTYETDRLPVIRQVLSRTDTLTTAIGIGNSVVRTLFNTLGPWIAATETLQANATATASQLALNYRDSPLSDRHGHGGTLQAGDRVPDLPVRTPREGAWGEARLHELLDPSRFVLLVTGPEEGGAPELSSPAPGGVQVAIVPSEDVFEAERFAALFGRAASAVLVRPDGYVGLSSPLGTAAKALAAYAGRWFSAPNVAKG